MLENEQYAYCSDIRLQSLTCEYLFGFKPIPTAILSVITVHATHANHQRIHVFISFVWQGGIGIRFHIEYRE